MQIKKLLGFDKPLMGRKQFLLNLAPVFILGFVFESFSNTERISDLIIQFAVLITAGCIHIPSLIRRSKDAGWDRIWWLGIIPLVNFIYIAVLIFKPTAADPIGTKEAH